MTRRQQDIVSRSRARSRSTGADEQPTLDPRLVAIARFLARQAARADHEQMLSERDKLD